jgi:hypothetical protein
MGEHPMHDSHFAYVQLPVHLEDEQPVVWHKGHLQEAMDREPKKTPLDGYFVFNTRLPTDPVLLEKLLDGTYVNVCDFLVWDPKNRVWKVRERCGKPTLGVLAHVSPKHREKYFFKLLLKYAKCPKGFKDVRTVDGVLYDTNYLACCARGLLKNDDEFRR